MGKYTYWDITERQGHCHDLQWKLTSFVQQQNFEKKTLVMFLMCLLTSRGTWIAMFYLRSLVA